MPHISKQQVSENTKHLLERQFLAWIKEIAKNNQEKILRELLSPTEQVMLAKRLLAILMILENIPTHDISSVLRISPSTVARFELKVDNRKYVHTHKWLSDKRRKNILRSFTFLFELPFLARRNSLSQLIKQIDSL